MKKQFVLVIMILIVCLSLTGCWSYIGLEEISIVSGMTLDYDEKTNEFIINFELIDTAHSSKEGEVKAVVIESKGPTIFIAIRNARKLVAKKLYLGSCKVIVIGSKMAKMKELDAAIDFLLRDPETREIMHIFISKGDEAKEIFTAEKVNSNLLTQSLFEIAEESKKVTQTVYTNRLFQIKNKLGDNKIPFIIPMVELSENNGKKVVAINGIAIIQNKKMYDVIDSDKSLFVSYADNKIAKGVISCDINNDGKDDVTYEVKNNVTTRRFEHQGEKIKLIIKIKTNVMVAELLMPMNTANLDIITELEGVLNSYLEKNIMNVVKLSQEKYKSDFMRVGETIHKQDYKFWNQISENWQEIYPNIEIEVQCKATILNTGLIK